MVLTNQWLPRPTQFQLLSTDDSSLMALFTKWDARITTSFSWKYKTWKIYLFYLSHPPTPPIYWTLILLQLVTIENCDISLIVGGLAWWPQVKSMILQVLHYHYISWRSSLEIVLMLCYKDFDGKLRVIFSTYIVICKGGVA